MTFSGESENFISIISGYLDYMPELLTDPKYFEQVKEVIQPVKDFINTLEENKPLNNISIAK